MDNHLPNYDNWKLSSPPEHGEPETDMCCEIEMADVKAYGYWFKKCDKCGEEK